MSIGTKRSCEIIAEVGVNHNGDIETAKTLVDHAARAGVDAVKFQTFVPDRVVTDETAKADYQERSGAANQREMLAELVLSEAEHRHLAGYCSDNGVEFLSTPYDRESVSLLESLGVERFKIASADIVNKPLLRDISDVGNSVILSTGMATLGEIERAVSLLSETGCPDLTLLHCVSCYPAEPGQVNMRFMETLRTAFDVPVGFSDHTLGTAVPVVAASRGAVAVEKHLTLDRDMEGPDHFASVEPDELAEIVDGIRRTEAALGTTIRSLDDAELGNLNDMRRSLYFDASLTAGTVLSRDDLKVVRPFDGLDPWEIDEVIGSMLDTDVEEDQAVSKDVLK